ncbi:MAG: hypothetical protein ACWA41_06585 [Putridiphycobacter sp.]
MGVFGIGILDNDDALDIKEAFYTLFNQKQEIDKIKQSVVNQYGLIIDGQPIIEDQTNSWLAYGLCLWEVGQLDAETMSVIDLIINEEIDLKNWKENDASEADLKSRKNKLNHFKRKLSKPPKKVKVPVTPKTAKAPFKKGDCIAYKLNNGNYGVSICLWSTEGKVKMPLSGFVATRINQSEFPKMEDVMNSYFLAAACNSEHFYDQMENIHIHGAIFSLDESEILKKIEAKVIGEIETLNFLNGEEPFARAGMGMFYGLVNLYVGPSILFEEEEEPNLYFKISELKNFVGNYWDGNQFL